jgi:hypothetical protein
VSEIGYVSPGSTATDALFVSGFRQALNDGGYVEGRNLNILFHFADTQFDQLPLLASDLVARRVAAIGARGAPAALAISSCRRSGGCARRLRCLWTVERSERQPLQGAKVQRFREWFDAWKAETRGSAGERTPPFTTVGQPERATE